MSSNSTLTAGRAAAPQARPARTRAASSNDPVRLSGVDGRSATNRRFRDLTLAFVADLGGPGVASEADKALARQAAGAVVASEQMQARIIRGEVVDLEQATRLANAAARLLQTLRTLNKAKPAKLASPLAAHFANPPTREARG